MIFSIDHGNAQVKTLSHIFTSGLIRQSNKPDDGREYVLSNGSYYTLSGESAAYKEDKTSDEIFRILTQFGYGRETRHQKRTFYKDTIKMGCDLPIEAYSLKKEEFAEYFRGLMEFEYCGTPYEINVSDVHVIPQGYAAAMAYKKKLGLEDYSVAIIIDGGGYDWDICILNNGRLNFDYYRSLDMGVLRYKAAAISYVQKTYGQKITGKHVDAALADEKTVLKSGIIKDIKDLAADHTNTFLNTLRQDGWDLRSSPTFFFGGAPMYFKKYLDGIAVDSVTFIDDLKANVLGVYKETKNYFAAQKGKRK